LWERVGERGSVLVIVTDPSPGDFAALVSDLSRKGRGEDQLHAPIQLSNSRYEFAFSRRDLA
jgi:hypothetical protein